jgi:multicomponent Na+:H+ antiporter subunit D
LLFASAGVFHHAGIKVPYFAFFAHDRGHRVPEAPLKMRMAMGLAALVCIGIGVAPGVLGGLYRSMPQTAVLLLASMAFTVLVRTGLYPPEVRSVNLDVDVIYRRALPSAWSALAGIEPRLRRASGARLRRLGCGPRPGPRWGTPDHSRRRGRPSSWCGGRPRSSASCSS